MFLYIKTTKRGEEMPIIQVKTLLEAPIEQCFNAARNPLDIVASVPPIKDSIVDSKLVNKVNLGDKFYIDTLLFKEKFKDKFLITTKYNVVEYVPPFKFSEEVTNIFFKEFKHVHEFTQKKAKVEMVDTIEYKMAFGFIGNIINKRYIDVIIRTYLYNRIKKTQGRLK